MKYDYNNINRNVNFKTNHKDKNDQKSGENEKKETRGVLKFLDDCKNW